MVMQLTRNQQILFMVMIVVDVILGSLFALAFMPVWLQPEATLIVPSFNLYMAPLAITSLLALPTVFFLQMIWNDKFGNQVYLLPLRLGLAYEFLHGGLEKLLDTTYLASPGLIQLGANAAPSEWVKGVMAMMLPNYAFFLLLIAVGELLVGLSMLFGGMTRLGAIGGILLQLVFLILLGWLSPSTFGVNFIGVFAFLLVGMHRAGRYLGLDYFLARSLEARKENKAAHVLLLMT
ncbi:MAG: DoxX family membrane protein [Candidatus Thorarchaeota archaeon]|nr:DoxX family membrane protein [Candidatus Thorarchaeota archaeon]